MLDFIFEIYKYAQLIPACKEVIELCYEYEHRKVSESWEGISNLLPEFCQAIATEDMSLANEIMNLAVEACAYTTSEVPNFIRMGDTLEECIPLLTEGMKYFSGIDVTEGDFRLVSSKIGMLSLENLSSKTIYNSTLDPVWEARMKAKSLYLSTMTELHVAGCDLGYFIWEMFEMSDMSLDIYVYHCNEKIVEYAFDYGLLSWIPEDKLHIIVDEPDKVVEKISALNFTNINMGFVQLKDFRDCVSKEAANKIMLASVKAASRNVHSEYTDINLWRNVKNAPKTICDIPKNTCDEWMVIVAGPSLDSNIDFIKQNRGKYKTIAATTVYKKLLDEGIVPDYLVVCDPQPRTYGHMTEISCFEPSLLLASTANWRFAEYYKGKKYLIPCASSLSSMTYFSNRGIKTVDVSGTVAYGAVQMAIFMGAKVIHLLGLDLAYPGNSTHANNTMDSKEVETKDLIMVPSVTGQLVRTSLLFKVYIDNMEELFLANSKVKFINHSKIGAAFKGTESTN